VQVGQELRLFGCETRMFESPEAALVHRVEELAEGFVTARDGPRVVLPAVAYMAWPQRKRQAEF